MTSGATFDAERARRYRLWRTWGPGPTAAWVMLNPSIADADADDPTIRRVTSFTRGFSYDGFEVVNLSPWIDPYNARAGHDAENLRHIQVALTGCDAAIVAWGTYGEHGLFYAPVRDVCALLTAAPLCLAVNKNGSPKHPLYVRADARLREWPGWSRYRRAA
jgi:hypothetical protein